MPLVYPQSIDYNNVFITTAVITTNNSNHCADFDIVGNWC